MNVPFDRMKAVQSSIEGMSIALTAMRNTRQQAEAEVGKWQATLDATLLIERYAQQELKQLAELKKRYEQEDQGT